MGTVKASCGEGGLGRCVMGVEDGMKVVDGGGG